MKFMVKTVGSTVLGIVGGWLGGFIGLGTELFSGFICSIIGWYWAKHLLDQYLD